MNFLKPIMNFFKSMLSGGDGSISTTRFITVVSAFTVLLVYVAQNVMAMIKCGGYADFPTNSVMVLLVVMGAKVGQSVFGEKSPTPVASDVAPADPVKPADKPSEDIPG